MATHSASPSPTQPLSVSACARTSLWHTELRRACITLEVIRCSIMIGWAANSNGISFSIIQCDNNSYVTCLQLLIVRETQAYSAEYLVEKFVETKIEQK